MHNVRIHSDKGWDTSGNFGRGGQKRTTEADRLAYKREYQKKLRERYKREGKNSRGYPLQKPLKWTPERLAKFKRTMRNKAKAKANRIQIVYPDPLDKELLDLGQVNIPTLKFCPNCGEHLEGWRHS